MTLIKRWLCPLAAALLLASCLSNAPVGIAPAIPANTTVAFDFYHRPLPLIPLPNDIATRYDATSPTLRRINASLLAPTALERRVRTLIDNVDGWGVFMPISIPFTGPLDVTSILEGHRDIDYKLDNDVVYLVNVDRNSDSFGTYIHLDVGNGNFPLVLEDMDGYWPNDPRGDTISLFFEETDEDTNGNGVLDPGEDTDADGVLDRPNYLPGANPDRDDLGARADALMTFYEAETHTLLVRPMIPLDERTTYAVVVTRRLKDADGEAVGSPFPGINHHSQTDALRPLGEVLAKQNLGLEDVAFAFTFTTQTIGADWVAVRDGLYGQGVQAHIGEQFPAEIKGFLPLRNAASGEPEDNGSLNLLYGEDWLPGFNLISEAFLGAKANSENKKKLIEANKAVDFHAVGYFESPQLFNRYDEEGRALPYNEQSWPADLTTTPASLRSERVYFHLIVPRKEISARKNGEPVPVVIMGHGYTGNRSDALSIGPYLARHGVAVIGIDCVSHGLNFSESEKEQLQAVTDIFGLGPFTDAVAGIHRAVDHNADGNSDSGGDFWTAYLFHTRDVVRQSALDYMQLVRIMKSFDGKRRWNFDFNGDGEPDIAGDFDGDGKVDIGGSAHVGITGASLGGIMAAVVAGVEPDVTASVPIAGGGGLGDVGNRSVQGGVREAVHLRIMGPLFIGTQAADASSMTVQTIIPNVNKYKTLGLATINDVAAGDTLLVENLANGEKGCGYVWDDEGTLRVRSSVESDLGDPVRLSFYAGEALVLGDIHCTVKDDIAPYAVVDEFGETIVFHNKRYQRGTPLVALAEGLGLRRANPELRRFMSIGQLVLDAADPAVLAQFMQKKPLVFANGQTTGAHSIIVTTAGDMNVPANTGISIGRAAGLIPYTENDERYGKPANQVLIDTYTSEAVEAMMRFTDSSGTGVIMDVENFSNTSDPWGADIPRLDPPLRLGFNKKDLLGGYSAAIFPFPRPSGEHGFAMPGSFLDKFREACANSCEGEACDACSTLDYSGRFDIGNYLFNMMGRFLATNGQELPTEACMSSDDCPWVQASPEPRW